MSRLAGHFIFKKNFSVTMDKIIFRVLSLVVTAPFTPSAMREPPAVAPAPVFPVFFFQTKRIYGEITAARTLGNFYVSVRRLFEGMPPTAFLAAARIGAFVHRMPNFVFLEIRFRDAEHRLQSAKFAQHQADDN